MTNLLDKSSVEAYDAAYAAGYNHEYPSDDCVRLERSYWNTREGRVLDYGFGSGENMIHLLKRGYQVAGIEVSEHAKKLVAGKLDMWPELQGKAELMLLSESDLALPFVDASFDYILSNQTIYRLASRTKISHLLDEFHRILKPGGKMIITVMGPEDKMCKEGLEIEPDTFAYNISNEMNNLPSYSPPAYIFRNEAHIRELFSEFQIDQIGFWHFSYADITDFHFVVLASKR